MRRALLTLLTAFTLLFLSPNSGVHQVRAEGFSVDEVKAIIIDAANEFGCSPSWMLHIAWRESRYQPWVTNKWSGAAGLFQFMPTTWANTDFADQSPYDPVAASRATAKWCSEGFTSPWNL